MLLFRTLGSGSITTLKRAQNLVTYPVIQSLPCFLPPSWNLPYASSLIPNVKKKLELPGAFLRLLRPCFQCGLFGPNRL